MTSCQLVVVDVFAPATDCPVSSAREVLAAKTATVSDCGWSSLFWLCVADETVELVRKIGAGGVLAAEDADDSVLVARARTGFGSVPADD